MREPWRDRRKRLDDLPDGRQLPRSLIHRADRAATKVPSIAKLAKALRVKVRKLLIRVGLSGAVYEPRTPPPQFEAQHLHAERKIFRRAGDGVAIVASVGRPIIESAAAFAALINAPPAKTHEVVNRPVSRNAINCVGAAYRADVSGEKNSHITASAVTCRPVKIALRYSCDARPSTPSRQREDTSEYHRRTSRSSWR